MEDIEYWYGNPSIEICKGVLLPCSSLTGKFCLIDIPTSLILSDLCNFLQDSLQNIQYLKIIKTSSSKVYGCAVLLHDPSISLEFLQEFSEKRYNPIEDYICNIVNISNWFPHSEDSSTMKDHCSICLESIDHPAISLLCGHLFHVKCLELWSDTTCPVCRYHQTPPDTNVCDTCNEEIDIRLCLICGERGCLSHSQQHFESTGHTFYQVIETSVTWDYSRQVTISRLIMSSEKLVEVHDGKKIESIMFEYNCLLSSLMETQREYYDKVIRDIETGSDDPLIVQIEELEKENREIESRVIEGTKEIQGMQELNEMILEELRVKKRLNEENEEINRRVGNRKVFKVTKEVLEEIKDLEQQIKEMNFYISTQKKLQDVGVESVEFRHKK